MTRSMRFYLIGTLLLLIGVCSCNNSTEKENTSAAEVIETDTQKTEVRYLKTDYPERVVAFKKMPDASVEEQVVKYERFSVLFIEYVGIYKNQPLYSPEDQENNTEAYNILRDELASIKAKLSKNVAVVSKSQEIRLDSADARMNKYLPQVYK